MSPPPPLSFVFPVDGDAQPAMIEGCLHHFRRAYPDAHAKVIVDGSVYEPHRRAIATIAEAAGVAHHLGTRLRDLSSGGAWWARLITSALVAPGMPDYIIRVAPETMIHRPFAAFPAGDVLGTIGGDGAVFGGCQAISTRAAYRLLQASSDSRLREPAKWCPDSLLPAVSSWGEILPDYQLSWMCNLLGITKAEWTEVDCVWARHDSQGIRPYVAASHPHRLYAPAPAMV